MFLKALLIKMYEHEGVYFLPKTEPVKTIAGVGEIFFDAVKNMKRESNLISCDKGCCSK